MKLNYNIIWVDDKIDQAPFVATIKGIEEFLKDKFFNVNIQTAEDFEEFVEVYDGQNEYDLIITDLNLNNGDGSEVIDFIRLDRSILTEIFFYSANSDLSAIEIANKSRISYFNLEGGGFHGELRTKILELISLTIAKFEHIVSMRGMIMHETSSLDVSLSQVLKRIIEKGDTNKIIDVIKNKHNKSSTETEKKLHETTDVDDILSCIGAYHRVRAILRNIEKNQVKEVLSDYSKEIIEVRNKFAHAVLENDGDNEVFRNEKHNLVFDGALCEQIRKDIIKHTDNLAELENTI